MQTHSQKDERADDRGSRQHQWEALLPQGPGNLSSRRGLRKPPPSGLVWGTEWAQDRNDDLYKRRRLWTRRGAETQAYGTLQRECLPKHSSPQSRPALPAEAVTRAGPGELSHHGTFVLFLGFFPSWNSEPGNSMESLAGGSAKAPGKSQEAQESYRKHFLRDFVLISPVFLPLAPILTSSGG